MSEADALRGILMELIHLMRDCAALNEGSAHSRAMVRVLDNADRRLAKVPPDVA